MIVTHNMQQAARVSDYTAFFTIENEGEPGRLVETGPTAMIFSSPANPAPRRTSRGASAERGPARAQPGKPRSQRARAAISSGPTQWPPGRQASVTSAPAAR